MTGCSQSKSASFGPYNVHPELSVTAFPDARVMETVNGPVDYATEGHGMRKARTIGSMTDTWQEALTNKLKQIQTTLLNEIAIPVNNAELEVGKLKSSYTLQQIKNGLQTTAQLKALIGSKLDKEAEQEEAREKGIPAMPVGGTKEITR